MLTAVGEDKNGFTQTLNPDSVALLLNWLMINKRLNPSNILILVPNETDIPLSAMSLQAGSLLNDVIWLVGDTAMETTLLRKIDTLAHALIQA